MKKDAAKRGVVLTADEMREELAVVSKMQSKAGVLFARRLGKADELAIRNEDVAAAHKLVEHLNAMTEKQRPRAATATNSGSSGMPLSPSSSKTNMAAAVAPRRPRSGRQARIA